MGASGPIVVRQLSHPPPFLDTKCHHLIETRRYFRCLHTNPLYARVPRPPLPVSERLSRDVLCLPLYAELPAEAVEEIVAEIVGTVESGR